jgi:Nuclease-related domain
VVADIAKLTVGREAYYTRELATDHEQYLSGHGESPGRWYGAGASGLGCGAKHRWPGSRPCSRAVTLLGPLERHGWAVLHDLAVPHSQANIDHLVIGPGGVFVIDSKQYRGRLQLDPSGRLWHGRYPLAPTLEAVSFEADQAAVVLPDPGMTVVPIVAVHGAQVPWARSWWTVSRSCRPSAACQACFATSRRYWGPSRWHPLPIRRGLASTPPPSSRHITVPWSRHPQPLLALCEDLGPLCHSRNRRWLISRGRAAARPVLVAVAWQPSAVASS